MPSKGEKAGITPTRGWCDVHQGWVKIDNLFRETVRYSKLADNRMIGVQQVTLKRICSKCLKERVQSLQSQKEKHDKKRENVTWPPKRSRTVVIKKRPTVTVKSKLSSRKSLAAGR